MKKIIISICLAALAIGCAKTEVQFEQTDAISFAPVAQVATKAALEDAGFNTTVPLHVFASAVTQVKANNTVTGLLTDDQDNVIYEKYLNNAEFTRSASTSPYTGSYYWPNVKALLFAGYVNAGNATVTVDDPVETMTISGYTQPDNGNNDFMYFFDNNEGKGYTKQTPQITPVMKHACSWLVFNFYGTTVTSGWKIHELKVLGIAKSGTATITASNVAWTEGAKNQVYQVYAYNATGTPLSTSAAPFTNEKNIIVIPQLPTELYVKYSYVSQAGTTIVEETTVPLAFNGAAEWAAGYKYTYDVTVTATAIEIKPTANTWTPYDADTSKEGNQSIPGTI